MRISFRQAATTAAFLFGIGRVACDESGVSERRSEGGSPASASRAQIRSAIATIAFAACAGTMGPAHAELVSLVEFYHAQMSRWFLTTSTAEMARLDTGVTPGWVRAQFEFKVDDVPGPGLVPVCRFFSTGFAPKSSHFYTAFPNECAALQTNPRWTFESEAFYVRLPDATGGCPVGTMAIYRGYNDGADGAPAHRFTPYPTDRCLPWIDGCTREGLGSDGVAFCAPASLELAQQRTQQLRGVWEFTFTVEGTLRTVTLGFGDAVAQYPPQLPPRYFPELPYISYSNGGVAGWDPISSKIAATSGIVGVGFLFDFDGNNASNGCAYVLDPEDFLLENRGPCHPLTIRRQ